MVTRVDWTVDSRVARRLMATVSATRCNINAAAAVAPGGNSARSSELQRRPRNVAVIIYLRGVDCRQDAAASDDSADGRRAPAVSLIALPRRTCTEPRSPSYTGHACHMCAAILCSSATEVAELSEAGVLSPVPPAQEGCALEP